MTRAVLGNCPHCGRQVMALCEVSQLRFVKVARETKPENTEDLGHMKKCDCPICRLKCQECGRIPETKPENAGKKKVKR